MNLNVEEGGGGWGSEDSDGCDWHCCRDESIDACEGSRRDTSIWENEVTGACIEGGGGITFDDDARTSQAAFSSSRLIWG